MTPAILYLIMIPIQDLSHEHQGFITIALSKQFFSIIYITVIESFIDRPGPSVLNSV